MGDSMNLSASRRRCQATGSSARQAWILLLPAIAMVGCLTMVAVLPAQNAAKQAGGAVAKDKEFGKDLVKRPEGFEVLATDGSRLRIRLLDETIPLKTPFGMLSIPATDIHSIDFASRVPSDVAERVAAAIRKLANVEFKVREEGGAELFALGAVAYAPLIEAAKNEDQEVAWRAEQLVERLRDSVDERLLDSRDQDRVVTASSQIAGTIDLDALRVETALFGEQHIQLALVRHLGLPGEAEDSMGPVEADPGTLHKYQNQMGQTLLFRVTGPQPVAQKGAVWGTNVYTLDSSLAAAAVHAGAVAPGQTAVVAVMIAGPQNGFAGSNRNGITSQNWGQYPGAFVFKPVKGGRNMRAPLQLRR